MAFISRVLRDCDERHSSRHALLCQQKDTINQPPVNLVLEFAKDTSRFDAWTKTLTHGLSRRGAVKVLAGAVVAGLAVRATLCGAAACTHGRPPV